MHFKNSQVYNFPIHKESLIFNIKGNSLEDGPGIRTVLFFKGCPLDCTWCHNPEGKSFLADLMLELDNCVTCEECLDICPESAIKLNENIEINREKCIKCFKCADVCPSNALQKCGKSIDEKKIIEMILKYKEFYGTEGGVTFSGGEVLQHIDAIAPLVKKLKEENIHILIETSGFFNYEKFESQILPYTDMIYYDIKLIDSDEHQKYCGVDNKLILDNFIKLNNAKINNNSFEILPRTPLIPDITDTEKNIDNIISFYKKLNINKTSLLPNNPVWFDKNNSLGLKNSFENNIDMNKLYNEDKLDKIVKKFHENRIKII